MGNFATDTKKQELKTLDVVVKETTKSIEDGKVRLFGIAENARAECLRVETELAGLNHRLSQTAQETAILEQREQKARQQLGEVSNNFEKYSESVIKKAFENVKELQIQLMLLKERHSQLQAQRKELGQRLTGLQKTAEQAEILVSHVGVVMDFIGGNLKDINIKIESIEQRQHLGLQIIKAQEEERKRVAREIHDGPAQSMANVVLRMEFCEKLLDVNPEKVRQELKELKEVVRGNLQDVRKIIFDLRPMALDDLGLVPALKRFLEDYRDKYGLVVETSFRGVEQRFSPALETALFRLIQEALNNVRKHACADRAKVTLDIKPRMIVAVVKDDGRGFDLPQTLAANNGDKFGLISMRERTELLGGRLIIKSVPGKGTEVNFRIPVTGQGGEIWT